MEDKRIRKTKKNLKETLIRMLQDSPFEKITVTDICREADISRITFYSHYSDKYALVDSIFADFLLEGDSLYRQKQAKNNPEYIPVKSYRNILDSILDIYYENQDFFRYIAPSINPYLTSSFYNIILRVIENHTIKEGSRYKLKYPPRQIAGFLCYGLSGFIIESNSDTAAQQNIRRQAKRLLTDILASSILVE